MSNKRIDRRSFVKGAVGSLAGIPLVITAAHAANPKLDEEDTAAVALGYKEMSSNVDSGKYPNHDEMQICGGCSLYVGTAEPWGDCAVFPGKQVAAKGWCAAFVAKPA